jgi:hypothetical protein
MALMKPVVESSRTTTCWRSRPTRHRCSLNMCVPDTDAARMVYSGQ